MAVVDDILNTLKKPSVLATIGAGVGGAIAGGGTGKTSSTTTVNPIEPAGYSGIGDLLRSRAMARLRQPFDTKGYEAGGIQSINDAYGGADMALQNKLTASGLSTSPVAGAAQGKFEQARGGSIAQFLNTIPEVQRKADMEDFGQVADFYNTRPLGQTQTTDTESTAPGGAAGGVAEGILDFLGQLYGQGKLDLPGGAGGGGSSVPGGTGPATGSPGGGGIMDHSADAIPNSKIPDLVDILPVAGSVAGGFVGTAGGTIGPSTAGTAITNAAANAALPSVGSVGPALSGPGASAAGGGAMAIIGPLLPIAAAAIPAYFAIKANQAHPIADQWVQSRQNPFDAAMQEVGKADPQNQPILYKFLTQQYLQELYSFAGSGDSRNLKVAQQALDTYKKYYGDPSKYGVNITLPTFGGGFGGSTTIGAKVTNKGTFSIGA